MSGRGERPNGGVVCLSLYKVKSIREESKLKLRDLVGSLENMLDLAIFMIGVYLSSTRAHIKFDISLYNKQNTYYL